MVTVTAASSGSGAADGTMLALRVLNNASLTQNGATAANISATKPQGAITPHATGSFIYGSAIVGDGVTTAPSSPLANTTSLVSASDTSNGYAHAAFRSTAVTASTSSATYGYGSPTVTAGQANYVLVEFLASGGTLAEDASTPAAAYTAVATTITTASFTPPAGSVLAAMVTANTTGAAANTIALTDSASAYTWTELASVGPLYASPVLDIVSIWAGIPKSVPSRLPQLLRVRRPNGGLGSATRSGAFSR